MLQNQFGYRLKCVAQVATLQEAPCVLRLSVRDPPRGCLPWFSKRVEVASCKFQEASWTRGATGYYEQTVESVVKNLSRLSRLPGDLPVKVKVCVKGRVSKCFLKGSLGTLLEQLKSSPDAKAMVEFSPTMDEQQVILLSENLPTTDGSDAKKDSVAEDTAVQKDQVTETPSVAEDTPVQEDQVTETPSRRVEKNEDEDDGWVTFLLNPITGKTLRLPSHTKEEIAGRWRGPGAWTSEDDLLDAQAEAIIANIKPLPNRIQYPKIPSWYDQQHQHGRGAGVVCPAEDEKQQVNSTKLFLEAELPTFPGEKLPERPRKVLQDTRQQEPDHYLTSTARTKTNKKTRQRRCRCPPILMAVIYIVLITWLVFKSENFLNWLGSLDQAFFTRLFNEGFVNKGESSRGDL